MPLNSDYLKDRTSMHNGEWRDTSAGNRNYYCCITGSPSEKDGLPCRHGPVVMSSHWSCCGSREIDSDGCSTTQPTIREHNFVERQARICQNCSLCTAYGKGCVQVGDRDRCADRGRRCGCGTGDSGCKDCGICRSCAQSRRCNHGEPPRAPVIPSPFRALNRQEESTSRPSPSDTEEIHRLHSLRSQLRDMSRLSRQPSPDEEGDDGAGAGAGVGVGLGAGAGVGVGALGLFQRRNPSTFESSQQLVDSLPFKSFDVSGSNESGLFEALANRSSGTRARRRPDLSSAGDASSPIAVHHTGFLQCCCAHSLGRVSFPLDPAYFHLSSCKWDCCGQSWNSKTLCTSAGATTTTTSSPRTKESSPSSTSKYEVDPRSMLYFDFSEMATTQYGRSYAHLNLLPTTRTLTAPQKVSGLAGSSLLDPSSITYRVMPPADILEVLATVPMPLATAYFDVDRAAILYSSIAQGRTRVDGQLP